ncbi:hypothetical protein [Streptomyces sp. NPDC001153]
MRAFTVAAWAFRWANSPARRLRSPDVRGRTVVQRTPAGAPAVADAGLLPCAGFVVAGATAEVLRRARPGTVTFVVTGVGGRAEEDLACAEYAADRVRAAGRRPGRPPGWTVI